ncbi:uncharacterized protein LOC130667410 isoform X1 [Microplitis mediator]|uniref:uncharacterized protein LOC130667410 isoform X1 n=2 Tax=Microplitis mediator TaxID=375433 RepID=UPI0025577450|nr:uncharacterized protein LOC130667410 isoform X1 [Microplitis mediator]
MMLVLFLCVIMKIAELSVGRVSPTLSSRHSPPYYIHNFNNYNDNNNNKLKRRNKIQKWINVNNKYQYNNKKRSGKKAAMMEDPQTPGSDCNSNPADPISQDLISSEFIQDNSDYQWFIDYGYRDGGLHVHPSVLSSLSTSYTQEDLGYYDDLARNLDANLAEVDMESFRTADIHTLLTALPVMCTDPIQQSEFNYQRERYASISGSVMEKIDIGSSISPHTSSQGEDSACSTADTISICKSSLLFSPVKETPVLPPGGSYSVDSLDCEDMLLTCQANNKNNYTIAFEGSMTMYSDGSQVDFESQDKHKAYEVRENYYNPSKIDLKNILDYSMACSDSKIYTTWSNLKHLSANKVMKRHGSGNNNTMPNFLQATAATIPATVMLNSTKRSLSLPDLRKTRDLEQINIPLNFSMDSAESHHQHSHSSGSVMSRSVNESSNSNTSAGKKIQNMSLVKLFIKQKSMSAEGMSLTLDQSDSASDNGWPTSNSSSESRTNTNTQIQINHHNNINDTCKNNIPDNDFSINWVKTDCYKSTETMSHDGSSSNTSKRVPSIKEMKQESPSVEELSESILKSEIMNDKIQSELLQLKDNNIKKVWNKSSEQETIPISKTTGIQTIKEVEDNAVQTSLIYNLSSKNDYYPYLRETFVDKKPVYVVYPNYALPDLSFLNNKQVKLDNVALKPQERVSLKKTGRNNRPFSCNDIESLKQRGFSHVKDWESLTFLLPTEYRKVLHDVPEVPRHIKLSEENKKPLFCLSPPMRHKGVGRNAAAAAATTNEILPTNISSSSSTGTQPSSGYRGSSTILSDSSSNQQTSTNPLYLYRYDSGSSENSLISHDKKSSHRPGSSVSQRTGNTGFSKRSISLPHGEKENNIEYTGKVPPRPPLPRSILRKNRSATNKRYSMFEMGGVEEVDDHLKSEAESNKRMSLQEPYYINNDLQLLRHGRIIDSDKDVDEVEEKRYAEHMREVGNYGIAETIDVESSGDDVKQLEEFLKRSGFSSSSDDGEDPDIRLRSYVRKFLALKMNKDAVKAEMLESQKKTVSFAVNRRPYLDSKILQLDIKDCHDDFDKKINFDDKQIMINSVNKAVDLLIKFWNTQVDSRSVDYNDKIECSQICLSNLCPALYAIMSDGLKPQINSTFGPIANSVWQVVEASSQQGPLTNTLNELVKKINSEDFMTEGLLKFHAFVFGLLNLRALDAWFAYLCTRETILRKHYTSSSLFVCGIGCANSRKLIDNFLSILDPLAFCPFQLDLLYQYRQLHNSFSHVNNIITNDNNIIVTKDNFDKQQNILIQSPKKIRPRSCGFDNNITKAENTNDMKKRWSNIAIGSKMFPVLDKLTCDDSEDYTDSLEHSPLNRASNRKNITRTSTVKNADDNDDDDGDDNQDNAGASGLKFKRLQEKWELMVGKDDTRGRETNNTTSPSSPLRTPTGVTKSKIPRLLTSPIKQPTNSLTGTKNKTVTGIPVKKSIPSTTNKILPKKPTDSKLKESSRRTSRVDQDHNVTPRTHLTRPSSLPYKSYALNAKEKNLISPQRRAVSTSLPRPNTPAASKANTQLKRPVKEVRTLTHRLPSDNGHLSFNEGDRLKVILEVDSKWLLCAKGDRKGLVPRACVHVCQT